MIRRIQFLALFLVCLTSGLVQARYVGPTRQGLSFHVSALLSEIYLPNKDLSNEVGDLFPTVATLTVYVLDINQKPVNSVPVTLDMEPACKSLATLSPRRVVTQRRNRSL